MFERVVELEQEVLKLKEVNQELYRALERLCNIVSTSRRGSMGAIDNVYVAQVNVGAVEQGYSALEKARGE